MVLTFEPGPCLVMFSSCDLCYGCQVIHRAILNITGIPSLKVNRTFMTLLLLAFVMYISKFLKTSIMCGMASLKGFYVPVNSILYRAKVRPSFAVPGHSLTKW